MSARFGTVPTELTRRSVGRLPHVPRPDHPAAALIVDRLGVRVRLLLDAARLAEVAFLLGDLTSVPRPSGARGPNPLIQRMATAPTTVRAADVGPAGDGPAMPSAAAANAAAARAQTGAHDVELDLRTQSDPVAVLALVTAAILERTALLTMHAGVVAAATGIVAIPAVSGAGKSTLTLALVRAGFGYLSDEALAVDRESGRISSFPRPVSVAGDVWPIVLADQGTPPGPREERLVRVSRLGHLAADGDRVANIVLPQRIGGRARLQPATSAEATVELLQRSFNHFRAPDASLQAILRIARGARVWRATYAEAPDLARLMADEFGVSAS